MGTFSCIAVVANSRVKRLRSNSPDTPYGHDRKHDHDAAREGGHLSPEVNEREMHGEKTP